MRHRVAVIGAGLGGLTAAGLLARHGCEVVLYEQAPRTGGKAGLFREGGLSWDLGPTLLTMPRIVRGVFEALGAADRLPKLTELPLQCEYRYPDGQVLRVHRDLEATAASVRTIHEGDGQRVETFYASCAGLQASLGAPYLDAPYDGVFGLARRSFGAADGATVRALLDKSLDGFARRFFQSPELQQFVGRFATYAGASPYEASASFATIAHVEHAEGVHHVQGGIGALAEALTQAAVAAGVTLRLGERASFAPGPGGRLRVGPGGDQDLYDAVVVNADPLAVEERRDAPLALSGVVLHLSCEAGAALPHHLILFSRDAREEFAALDRGEAPEDPTVYVCRPSATDPSMASGGREPLFVMVNAPARWDGVPDEVPEALEARALAKVAALPGILGLKRHGARGPRELALLGAPGGSIYGFVPRGRLGPLRRPRLRSRQPGVFFAGGGTHPGGGVPLVMRSGEFAAALALEHVRQKSGRAVA